MRTQSLRYAIDDIINTQGFDHALDMYFKGLIFLTEMRNRIFYTDGHFSNYYGSNNVPMGYDPRRQVGAKGRTSVYLHNTEGEVMFLFESATNTSLSNDIETLVAELAKKGMKLKRKTLFFDRGGYSKKCFSYLQKNKMYFVTYLKYRAKERRIDEREFVKRVFQSENESCEYFVYEAERRWAKGANHYFYRTRGSSNSNHNKQRILEARDNNLLPAKAMARGELFQVHDRTFWN